MFERMVVWNGKVWFRAMAGPCSSKCGLRATLAVARGCLFTIAYLIGVAIVYYPNAKFICCVSSTAITVYGRATWSSRAILRNADLSPLILPTSLGQSGRYRWLTINIHSPFLL